MKVQINYNLNGGDWAPKDEVKESFYTDLYNFVNNNFNSELKSISLEDFISFEPYIIGNLVGKYFLLEEVGGKVENQPSNYFIGYCYQNNKYLEIIPHLIHFFALWREIERCMELNANDFFANSWASLVDTAKFFKYTTVEDLEKSPEAPTVRDERILYMLQNCPGIYTAPLTIDPKNDQRLPKPRKDGYEFIGWYDNPQFKGDKINIVSKESLEDLTYYARWATHTYFHSNDGYATFDDLYTDFLIDFSEVVGYRVEKHVERIENHGLVTEFCKASFNGNLNKFFAIKDYYTKWWWLIEYLRLLKKNNQEMQSRFDFKDGEFGLEAQVRWELNSLFVSRFHLVWPKTSDYSGAGIKEKIADSTNSSILKVRYPVGDNVLIPIIKRVGYEFSGWYDNPNGEGEVVININDDRYASKTLYAKWNYVKE